MSGKMSALVAKQILVLGNVLFNALWSPSMARSRGAVDGRGAWGARVLTLALSLTAYAPTPSPLRLVSICPDGHSFLCLPSSTRAGTSVGQRCSHSTHKHRHIVGIR